MKFPANICLILTQFFAVFPFNIIGKFILKIIIIFPINIFRCVVSFFLGNAVLYNLIYILFLLNILDKKFIKIY